MKHYARRRWWFTRRTPLFWTTFVGCVNFDRHLTWRGGY